MSTSLLYHTCGIRGYEYRSTEYICGTTVVHIEQPREKLRCPHCGRAEVSARGSKSRIFRSVPIGSKPVAIMLEVARVYCPKCNATRQVRVGFADEYRRHTRAFARYGLELTRMGTIQDVADHLHVGWDLIKELKKSDLARRYRKVKLRGLKHLAIDEICIGRGRRFRTLVLDLDTGAIVFVGQGKGADALKPFWKRLKASRAKIMAVAADLSRAYTKAVRENLPAAALVYDRFHVVKLFNEKLSDLRRELYREATDQLEKQVLKGTRWLLLMNPENLDDAKGERQHLEEALWLNESLAKAYYLKEDLRQFWEQSDRAAADRFLISAFCAGRRPGRLAHGLAGQGPIGTDGRLRHPEPTFARGRIMAGRHVAARFGKGGRSIKTQALDDPIVQTCFFKR